MSDDFIQKLYNLINEAEPVDEFGDADKAPETLNHQGSLLKKQEFSFDAKRVGNYVDIKMVFGEKSFVMILPPEIAQRIALMLS